MAQILLTLQPSKSISNKQRVLINCCSLSASFACAFFLFSTLLLTLFLLISTLFLLISTFFLFFSALFTNAFFLVSALFTNALLFFFSTLFTSALFSLFTALFSFNSSIFFAFRLQSIQIKLFLVVESFLDCVLFFHLFLESAFLTSNLLVFQMEFIFSLVVHVFHRVMRKLDVVLCHFYLFIFIQFSYYFCIYSSVLS